MSKRLGYTIQNAGGNFTTSTISNLLATNVTSVSLLASNGITTGNINFTGNLYQNGQTYLSSQWLTGTGGNLSYTNGNVGIGTTSPQFNLHVIGSSYISEGITTGNINFTGNLYQNGQTYISSQWLSGTGGSLSYTNGNVGIGTTDPSVALAVNGSAIISTSVSSGAIYSTNLTSTNIVATNASAATLNLTTGITAARAQITNANVTTSTIATLLNTNAVSTNITSATLNLSIGITAASAQITNINATAITSAGFSITNFNTTNITTQSILVTGGGLRATFTSNTMGPIVSTTTSIGINTVSPRDRLEVVASSSSLGTAGVMLYSGVDNGGVNNLLFHHSSHPSAFRKVSFKSQGLGSNGRAHFGICVNTAEDANSATFADSKLFIHGSSGNVGIGTSTPSVTLDVNGTARFTTGITSASLRIDGKADIYGDILIGDTSGNYAGFLKTSYESSGANQVVIESLRGEGGILFRTNDGGTVGNRMRITNNGSVGIGTTFPSANLHVNGSAIISTGLTTASARITTSLAAVGNSNTVGSIFTTGGNVGIGSTAPSYALQVVGDVYASGDVISFSDSRLKTSVETIDNALDKIEKLRGVYYTHVQTQKRGVGLIAQEAQQVIPEAVIDKGEDTYLGVAYGNIVGMLVQAIKELSEKVQKLEKQLE
jgi:hypothetical protein